MRFTKFVVPAFVLATGFLINTSMSFAKPEDMKATKKSCVFCHETAKGGKDNLTAAGKYYKEKKSLEGFEAKKETKK